jgi:hypothetical protein
MGNGMPNRGYRLTFWENAFASAGDGLKYKNRWNSSGF